MGKNINRKKLTEFNSLRRIMVHLYTYGLFTREDYIRTGLAGSTRFYDDVIRLLRDLFGQAEKGRLTVSRAGKYRRYRFQRDYFRGQSLLLEAAFGLHRISEKAVRIVLFSLSRASETRGISVSEISRGLTLEGLSDDEADCTASVSRRLRDLKEAGYLISAGRRYRRSDVCDLGDMKDADLFRLYYLASFFAQVGHPRIPAVYTRNALRRQLLFRGLQSPPEAFLLRDNTSGNLLDEELVYQLSECCRLSKKARLKLHGRELDVEPVSFRVDARLGRWYLMALQNDLPLLIRVSNIECVRMLKETFNAERAGNIVRDAFRHGGVSGSQSSPAVVEAELHFDDPIIRRQFEREIIHGYIERRDGQEIYHAEISDVSELRPLLRAYGPWLRVLPGDGHTLDAELRTEYERMLRNYETLL